MLFPSWPSIFFHLYSDQDIFEMHRRVAEEFGITLPDDVPLVKLKFLDGAAIQKRVDRQKLNGN